MSYSDETESLENEAWDEKFFSLIYDLAKKNASRYENQARTLLKNKSLKVSVSGIEIRYKLTPIGCWYFASENLKGSSYKGWSRMGWRKSSKIKALPNFFAGSEAGVLMDLPE